MIAHFIKIVYAVQLLHTVCAFLNGFEQDLSFTCLGKHQTISHIESVHRDSHEDRQFDISCSDVLDSTETNTDCLWTGYANYFDHTLASQCPDNYFINGVTSHFEKCCKDRIWKFYCCKIQGYNLVNCDTASWNNKFDLIQNFTVPAGRFLKSVTSIYQDHYGDREFKFETCDWTVNDPIDQHRDYGALVHPGSSFVNDWDKELLFECPDQHQSIVYVESAHENYFDDRVFKLACVDVVQNIGNRAINCSWSAEVNAFEEDFAYSCPCNSFIQGMRSYHDNTKEDRVWRYKCCQVKGIGIGNCKIENWTNLFDNYQKYIIPDNTVMAGVISQFADEQNDRVWRYEVCRAFNMTQTLTEIVG